MNSLGLISSNASAYLIAKGKINYIVQEKHPNELFLLKGNKDIHTINDPVPKSISARSLIIICELFEYRNCRTVIITVIWYIEF